MMSRKSSSKNLLRRIHEDEGGAVSIETVLIIAVIAIPILIFVYKYGWPAIKDYFNEGLEELGTKKVDGAVHVGMGQGDVEVHPSLGLERVAVFDALKKHAPDGDHPARAVRAGAAVNEQRATESASLVRQPDQPQDLIRPRRAARGHAVTDHLDAELLGQRLELGSVLRREIHHDFQVRPAGELATAPSGSRSWTVWRGSRRTGGTRAVCLRRSSRNCERTASQ